MGDAAISEMIFTTKGYMAVETLRCERGEVDNENEHTSWVEYWDGDELVHRSAHIHLKKGVVFDTATGNINGQ